MLQTIRSPVMIFAILHRRPHFDQVAVRIVETNNLLPPTMCHETVHILDFRIVTLQLFDKAFNIRFFKIKFGGIVLRNDLPAKKLRPVFLFLQNQTFGENHMSIIIEDQLKTKQVMVELSGFFNIFHNYQYIL